MFGLSKARNVIFSISTFLSSQYPRVKFVFCIYHCFLFLIFALNFIFSDLTVLYCGYSSSHVRDFVSFLCHIRIYFLFFYFLLLILFSDISPVLNCGYPSIYFFISFIVSFLPCLSLYSFLFFGLPMALEVIFFHSLYFETRLKYFYKQRKHFHNMFIV